MNFVKEDRSLWASVDDRSSSSSISLTLFVFHHFSQVQRSVFLRTFSNWLICIIKFKLNQCFVRSFLGSLRCNTFLRRKSSVFVTLWNRFKPSSKIFLWPFQGGSSFMVLCVIYVLCLSCFRICSLLPCDHLMGKGWPLGSCLWWVLWFCYFPIWYPGIGVVLDCIDFWSLLSVKLTDKNNNYMYTL